MYMYSVRQTDGRTDEKIMLIADHTAYQYDGLKLTCTTSAVVQQ